MSQTLTEARSDTRPYPAKMTYDEFLQWADEDTHAEWVNGEIIFVSPVSLRHQRIGGFLFRLLSAYVDAKGLGEIFYAEFQMKLGAGGSGREPDLLFVAKEHLSRLQPNYLDVPADLVVEIISPESIERDRVQKFAEYQRGGVGEYWLIDPTQQSAEFSHRAEDGIFHAIPPDEQGRCHSRALAGFWLDPRWLWQEPLPSPSRLLKEWKIMEE